LEEKRGIARFPSSFMRLVEEQILVYLDPGNQIV
jgi:hypothetical protein